MENKIYTKDMLMKMPTEQLVSFISYHRLWGKYEIQYDTYVDYRLPEDVIIPDRDDYILVGSLWDDNCQVARYWANETALREILKTRPNIPNKEQKTMMRKKAAAEARKSVKRNLKYSR